MTKYCYIIPLLLLTLTLIGCGQNDELSTFENDMSVFSDTISNLDDNINAIEANSEDAVTKLLGYLDEMDSAFINLGEMTVPAQFIGIESLADEASEYMTASVSSYHKVLTSSEMDEYSNTLATESYQRAMTRLHYISDILQGKIPEGEDISVVHSDEDGNEIPEGSEPSN